MLHFLWDFYFCLIFLLSSHLTLLSLENLLFFCLETWLCFWPNLTRFLAKLDSVFSLETWLYFWPNLTLFLAKLDSISGQTWLNFLAKLDSVFSLETWLCFWPNLTMFFLSKLDCIFGQTWLCFLSRNLTLFLAKLDSVFSLETWLYFWPNLTLFSLSKLDSVFSLETWLSFLSKFSFNFLIKKSRSKQFSETNKWNKFHSPSSTEKKKLKQKQTNFKQIICYFNDKLA
jgi:hypothetical protein